MSACLVRQGLSGAFGFGALKKGAVQFYSLNEHSDKQQVTSNRPWTSYRLQSVSCVYLTPMVGWPQYLSSLPRLSIHRALYAMA